MKDQRCAENRLEKLLAEIKAITHDVKPEPTATPAPTPKAKSL